MVTRIHHQGVFLEVFLITFHFAAFLCFHVNVVKIASLLDRNQNPVSNLSTLHGSYKQKVISAIRSTAVYVHSKIYNTKTNTSPSTNFRVMGTKY